MCEPHNNCRRDCGAFAECGAAVAGGWSGAFFDGTAGSAAAATDVAAGTATAARLQNTQRSWYRIRRLAIVLRIYSLADTQIRLSTGMGVCKHALR